MDYAPLVAAVFLLIGAAGFARGSDLRAKRQDLRLQRLERKVDLLLAQAGIVEPEDPRMAELDALLAQGKKIQAIKVHREVTGSGLAEAKEAVERRMR
ncbi:ribosomal protein L7/L12 [Streptomyces sp. NPDC047049]|uniref:ribosomal protein L7/L12 n=1 Tax=Streptomyces sp. NPDC047049 TaxID=3156688 RepID=UPI0033DA14C3